MSQISRPDWRDSRLGARIRVVLWLHDEVGEGRPFRRQQLRNEVWGVAQVDRGMRDLRSAGCITTYRDMVSPGPDELFLEKVGVHVWKPGRRSAVMRAIWKGASRGHGSRSSLLPTLRYRGGEEYPDDPGSSAPLTIGHASPCKHRYMTRLGDLVTERACCSETAKYLTGLRFSADPAWSRIHWASIKGIRPLCGSWKIGALCHLIGECGCISDQCSRRHFRKSTWMTHHRISGNLRSSS